MKKPLLLAFVVLLSACHAPKQGGSSVPQASVQTHASAAAATQPSALHITLALVRYRWRLASATDAQGQPITALLAPSDKPLQLDFNASVISVGNACNPMSGHYRLDAGRLNVEPLTSAMATCADPHLATLGKSAHQRLQGMLEIRLEGADEARLTLVTASGDTLTFDGSETTSKS